MDSSRAIEKVREFNRFYMPVMKLLGSHYLGSEYSVTDARIFFEIYENPGCTASYISSAMQIDKSYLSKILAGHEKRGFLQRLPSAEDRRSYNLYLTSRGKEQAEEFIRRSNDEIKTVLQNLSESELLQLAQAFDRIMALLR